MSTSRLTNEQDDVEILQHACFELELQITV